MKAVATLESRGRAARSTWRKSSASPTRCRPRPILRPRCAASSLQRVDTTRGRTVIFAASSPEGAKALAAALGAKVAEASADDLRAPGPVAE